MIKQPVYVTTHCPGCDPKMQTRHFVGHEAADGGKKISQCMVCHYRINLIDVDFSRLRSLPHLSSTK